MLCCLWVRTVRTDVGCLAKIKQVTFSRVISIHHGYIYIYMITTKLWLLTSTNKQNSWGTPLTQPRQNYFE